MVHLAGADMLESRGPKRQPGSLRGQTLNLIAMVLTW